MAKVRLEKVVSSLPTALIADTIYNVRVGAGYDQYITDENGVAFAQNVGSDGGAISDDLPVPDLFDESDPNFFYFGWENVNGGWLVQRQNRSTSITESATTGHANLTDAFADRTNLGYS